MKLMIDYLLEIARSNGIDVEYLPAKPSTPDVSMPFENLIIMNPNFVTRASHAYRLAHELAHVIYGDRSMHRVYAFSLLAERTEEVEAHRRAIELLANYENGFTDYVNVMSAFGIPASFEETVQQYVIDYK